MPNGAAELREPTLARRLECNGTVLESAPDPAVYIGAHDPAIQAEEYALRDNPCTAAVYQVRSTGVARVPGILVVHEKLGLTAYVRNVARRLAKAGYVAMAPDLLWRQGGTASFPDEATVVAAIARLDIDDTVADLRACVSALVDLDVVIPDRIGAVGFCFGGGLTWRLATKEPRLRVAVPFYGPNPPLADVPAINAAVLAVYAELDDRINPGIDEIEHAMRESGKVFDKVILPNARHAFHNDTMAERYNPEAARKAWHVVTDWLADHLKGQRSENHR